jgi:hypothetical protein
MEGNTAKAKLLYNTYMVSTTTTLYDKFTPAFVYW